MKKYCSILIILAFLIVTTACTTGNKVEFVQKEDQVDVMIDGKLFTSYMHTANYTKPILYPLNTPSGIVMTRSYPFAEVEGESHDHPHHAGLFFTYDLVNKDGFWNNTEFPPQIKHIKITEMKSEKDKGTLSTISHWNGKSGKTLLEEERTMVFSAGQGEYVIDMTMKLTAKDTAVVFNDTKEGMFAIRVAHWLKEKGGSGKYMNAKGEETAKNVWGRRSEWVVLQGSKDENNVGIAILNHPESTNYPTYWHARNYGLFSANPLGQSVFQKATGVENPEPFTLTLQQGESALFKFQVIIYDGTRSKEQMEQKFKEYSQS